VLKHAFDRVPRLTYELAVTKLVWRFLSTNVAGGGQAQRVEHPAHPTVLVEAPTRSQA
jgi:hypothetical protein